MPAETAAAPGATGANQSEEQRTEDGGQRTEHAAPIGERMPDFAAYDKIEGLPEEIRREVDSAKEEAASKGQKTEARQEQQQPQPAKAAAAAEEETLELTEEDRRNTDPKLLARIDKLTFQKNELKRQLERESRVENPASGQPGAAPAATAPAAKAPAAIPATAGLPERIAKLQTPEEIQERAQVARGVLKWAKLHRDGAEGVVIGRNADGTEIVRDYTAREIAEMEVSAEEELQEQLPVRFQEIQTARQQETHKAQVAAQRPFWDEQLREDYPELETEKESPLAKSVEMLLETFPFLKEMPDGRLTAADVASAALKRAQKLQAKGQKTEEKDVSRVTNPASGASAVPPEVAAFFQSQPKRAPAVPKTDHGAPPPPSADAAADAAMERYLETKSPEDYARWSELSKGQPVPA